MSFIAIAVAAVSVSVAAYYRSMGADATPQYVTAAVTRGQVVDTGRARVTRRHAMLRWSTTVTSSSILLSFGVAAATGIFFGFYPARKAASLDPIEALRHE
jgi:ABC-type antimicrobial peptide transport system permease subunit